MLLPLFLVVELTQIVRGFKLEGINYIRIFLKFVFRYILLWLKTYALYPKKKIPINL